MGTAFSLITYAVSTVFLIRVVGHLVSWARGMSQQSGAITAKSTSPATVIDVVLDILLFRRLFRTNKALWVASWTFHLSFALVLVRHLRYLFYPVPAAVMSMQGAGEIAGYLLPLSLLMLLALRLRNDRDSYVSFYNFYLAGILLLAAVTGLFLKFSYRTDLVDVKAFMLGILSAHFSAMPDSVMFIVHYVCVLFIIPAVPLHLIAAPLITMDARRREEGIHMVIHEK
jgi:nitrate reductase gamma subunit